MVQPVGYLKLWRELLTKPIWTESTPEQKVILITLLAMANYNGKEWEWQGKQFKAAPGQFVTSLDKLAQACGKGITVKNVRTALKRFEKYGFLADEGTKTGRLISIVNWGTYQGSDDVAGKATGKEQAKGGQSSGKERAPREEGKEGKEGKKEQDADSLFETLWKAYPEKKGKGKISDTQKKALLKIGEEELLRALDRYKASKADWQNWQHGSSFWNKGYIDYLDENYQEPIKPQSYNGPITEVYRRREASQ